MTITFQQATLPNGLRILAETDPEAHTAAVGFFVRAGARDEAPAAMGVSHFLEHMMFKGTERRSAADVDREFDELGADHNAFTTSELTAFHAHGLPEHLPAATGILADILRPALRPSDFEDEKPVILEEIAMYEDHPFWTLYEEAMEAYYRDHPLGHRVLGTRESITALTRDEMAAYFQERYSADNTVVALAGRLEFERMVELIERDCGSWLRTEAARDTSPLEPATDDLTIEREQVNRHYTLMLAPAPAMQDEDRYAAGVLAQILGDCEGSRLYWSLVETGLAEEAQADYSGRDGVGEYLVYLGTAPEQAAEAEAIARRAIDGLGEDLNEDELLRARSKIATAATLHGELPAGRMRRLGRLWTYTRRYRSLEEELARIEAVTLDELRDVLGRHPFTPRVVARLRPSA
jgi:predicted Zn-dependent peptidase